MTGRISSGSSFQEGRCSRKAALDAASAKDVAAKTRSMRALALT